MHKTTQNSRFMKRNSYSLTARPRTWCPTLLRYTGGRIIEVDQELNYTPYNDYGSYTDPYIINLPAPVTTNTSSEGWATTCLPFNAAVPDGVTVFAASGIEGGALKLQKVEGCTILPKETPVLQNTSTYNVWDDDWSE